MTSQIVSAQRQITLNQEYLGKYWSDAAQTCHQYGTSGKTQNNPYCAVAMATILLLGLFKA